MKCSQVLTKRYRDKRLSSTMTNTSGLLSDVQNAFAGYQHDLEIAVDEVAHRYLVVIVCVREHSVGGFAVAL